MAEIKTLYELEGEIIVIMAPNLLHPTVMQKVRLHKVEDAGIWIESQVFNEKVLRLSGVAMAPKTIVFFLPWQQISWILNSLEVPAISGTLAD